MAYLPEHMAPKEETNPEGDLYQPSDQDKKDIKTVEKLFEEAKKRKSKYDQYWNDFYNMFRGRQWKEKRPSYRHSEVINLIFREIQSAVPIQMDSRPKFEFLPQGPEDLEISEIINQVCESDWTKYSWLTQLTEMIYDANILGTGIGYVGYDFEAEGGLGAVCIDSEDPFYVFPDPNAHNVNKKAKYFIRAEPMGIDEIKAKWDNGKYVKADMVNIKKMDLFDKNNQPLRSNLDVSVVSDSGAGDDGKEKNQALVITCYFDGSYETEEEKNEKQNADGTVEVSFIKKKKHPLGRKVVIASKVVLESGENEFEDGRFPFARVQNYINQRQFWGISDIEQLDGPQKVFNKLISFSLDVLTLMGNPIWKVGTGAGVDTDNLFNQPGLIVEAQDISQIQREEGVQLQPYVLQLIDRVKLWFDDVSGSSDASRGVRPEGVTAASAIQSLQEATQTRLRQKARNLDACLQEMGQLYLSRIMQFYTAPRVFRLTNKDGSMKFFKFHIEQGPEGKLVRYKPFTQGEGGQVYEGEEKQVPIKGLLDVKVSTGSTLPFAKAEKEQKSLNLFDRGIIDEEEVLKNLDYPNWEAVLQRVQERKAAMAEAQAQAQGAPTAP